MAANRIEVTSAQLRQRANQLEQLNNRYKGKINDLNEKEARLNGQWDGDANDVFHKTFMQNKGFLDKFSQIVDRYIAALRAAADEYDRAEAQAAGIATTI